jgi:hypothetical protein
MVARPLRRYYHWMDDAMTHYGMDFGPLLKAGIEYEDALALRRISMVLHRWHELECGDNHGCISREGEDGTGRPFWDTGHASARQGGDYDYIPDREKGALRRLAAIMKRYPTLAYYVQGDPRGASLYILRPGDVPDGANVDSYYNRGLAVYR